MMMSDVSSKNEKHMEKLIQVLEEQLAHSNQQNQELSKQIESLTQQVQHLTKCYLAPKRRNQNTNARWARILV